MAKKYCGAHRGGTLFALENPRKYFVEKLLCDFETA